jgi:EmrB/QacA subfamily drug resistance transporter
VSDTGALDDNGARHASSHASRCTSIGKTADEERRRWSALYVLCVGMLMIVLDATIVNVALPSIQEDLGFSQNNLAWVVNAYLIAFGGLLLLAGRIGDLIGQRRVFLFGLATFTGASLLCAMAQNQGLLIAARFVQGAGGALTSAVILGMIVTMFPQPGEQARAIGIYTFVAVAGGSIGLLAGGVLTESINWHWIFFVNIPIGIATGLFAIRLVPDREGIGLMAGADIPGAVLLTGSLMLGVYTILGVADKGWGSTQTLALGAVSIGLLGVFLARQAKVANPLMPLRLFRSRNVSGANLVQALLVVGMFAMFFLGALYMQRILGYNALQVGFAYLPMTVVMGTMSFRVTGQLNLRYGPQATLIPAMVFIVAGLLLLARTPVDASYVVDLLPAMILIGVGAGLGFPSLMTLAMSGATASDSGLASGLVNTSVQVGGAIGLAVLATLATERTNAQLDNGASTAAALNSGYHLAYLIGVGLVLVAIAVAVSVLRERSPTGDRESVPETPSEQVPGTAKESAKAPVIRAKPLPAAAPGADCQETGMGVVIGCGGCAGSAPSRSTDEISASVCS